MKVVRRRPEGARVLAVHTHHVRGRPGAVFDALLATVTADDPARARLVDDRALQVVTHRRGGIREELRVVADDHGSHIDHLVLSLRRAERVGRRLTRHIERAARRGVDHARRVRIDVE